MSNNRPDVTWFHISLASSDYASSAHICSQFHYISSAFVTVVIKAEHVSGAENGRSGPKIGWSGAERRGAERSVERTWQKTMERERSAERERSGLNRPLTARSNLTFHWLRKVYSPHSYCVLLQSALFYSSCTRLVTCSNPARPLTYITH